MSLEREEIQNTSQALLARMKFYRELGLTDFYRREVAASPLAAELTGAPAELPDLPFEESPASQATLSAPATQSADLITPSTSAPHSLAEKIAALEAIRAELGDCTRCPLHSGRNKLVFADGNPAARIMFIGEGPGADEDEQGIPFVGKAGQLLNNMINAMGLKREEVYIANVVKCRPPANRAPEPEEANTCTPFLFRQIIAVRPELIVALGATAATYLLGHKQPLAGLRGRLHSWRGTKLVITYHPAYLLRDPRQKKEAWVDLQLAMRELGLKPPAKA